MQVTRFALSGTRLLGEGCLFRLSNKTVKFLLKLFSRQVILSGKNRNQTLQRQCKIIFLECILLLENISWLNKYANYLLRNILSFCSNGIVVRSQDTPGILLTNSTNKKQQEHLNKGFVEFCNGAITLTVVMSLLLSWVFYSTTKSRIRPVVCQSTTYFIPYCHKTLAINISEQGVRRWRAFSLSSDAKVVITFCILCAIITLKL